ncbi:MAG TPA: hypothetical protein VMY76_05615 [Gemmatimonadales bacterium]|nr:hypothetical protein [Gemmatimonadales bacterium]
MAGRTGLGRGGRFVAACLAGIWLACGSMAMIIGVSIRPGLLPTILGLLGVAYGWLWARVALTGRRQHWALGRRPRGRDNP